MPESKVEPAHAPKPEPPPAPITEPELSPPSAPPPAPSPWDTTPDSEPSPAAPPEPTPQPPRKGSPLTVWLVTLGFLLLAGSQAALWVRDLIPPPESASPDLQIRDLDARLTRLEQQPSPPAPDLRALTARVTALEQRPAASPAPAPAPNPPDLAPLQARITTLEQRTAASAGTADSLAARLSADERMLAALDKADPARLADRAQRIARIQAATMALSLGRPLGTLDGAPPPLARYATTAPPTVAALRLAFPEATRAALAASRPVAPDKPFLERIWTEAQNLITVRQGDRVVVGDPSAGILARARISLDAGDLAGASATLEGLNRPAAQALAAWLDQLHGLLAARAALAELAAQT